MIQLSQASPSADRLRLQSRILFLAGALAFSVLALLGVFGLAKLLGVPVRRAAFIADRASAPAAELRYTEAPQSAAFFEDRDSVTVRVPWDMSVGEFLSLYHLENNASARAALERQLGASRIKDPLREGDEISFRLTATRGTDE